MNPRLAMILIALIFLAPIIGAVVLNSKWVDWQPEASRNHGDLIAPVLPLQADSLPAKEAIDHWRLLVLCQQDDCAATHDVLLRVKKALNRHGQKLDLASNVSATEPYHTLPEAGITALQQWNPAAHLVLVDPLDNAMMWYPEDFNATGLRKDLDRLLKYNKTGEQ